MEQALKLDEPIGAAHIIATDHDQTGAAINAPVFMNAEFIEYKMVVIKDYPVVENKTTFKRRNAKNKSNT